MEDHFTAPRLQNYLMECKGDKGKAILLYRWNSELSAAFWESIGYLEVAFRNRIDHQLTVRHLEHGRTGHSDWISLFAR